MEYLDEMFKKSFLAQDKGRQDPTSRLQDTGPLQIINSTPVQRQLVGESELETKQLIPHVIVPVEFCIE